MQEISTLLGENASQEQPLISAPAPPAPEAASLIPENQEQQLPEAKRPKLQTISWP